MEAILHIGDMKCGSKSVQKWLGDHEEPLTRQGVLVSGATRMRFYHSLLPSYALDDEKIDNDPRREWHVTTAGQVAAHRQDVEQRIAREVATAPRHIRQVVFSHELLLSLAPDEVRRLVALLGRHFTSIRVVAYIRRQDRQFVSMWGQALKTRDPGPRFFEQLARSRSYLAMLRNWERAVGREHLAVRVLRRDAFPDGCLARDFCGAAGIGWDDDFTPAEVENESLDAVAQSFLLSLHRRSKADEAHGRRTSLTSLLRFRRRREPVAAVPLAVNTFLNEHRRGRGILPPRRWATSLIDGLAAENEEIRRRYRPDLGRLFDDEFSSYPEDGTPPCTAEDAFALAADMWESLHGGISRRDVDMAYRLVLGRPPDAEELASHLAHDGTVGALYERVVQAGRCRTGGRAAA